MEETETLAIQESAEFPLSNQEELKRLRELVGKSEVEIIDLGEFGYVIHNNRNTIIAEAPWILLDFDDSTAETSKDKVKTYEGCRI